MTRYLIAAVAALCLAASCTEPCVQLAEKLCDCEPTESAKDTCKQEAADRAGQVEVSSAEQDRCDALIDGCDCRAIDTPEGKVACGLANDPAAQQ